MPQIEDKVFTLSARDYYTLLDALSSAHEILSKANGHMAGNSRTVDHVCIYDEHDLCFECDATKNV